MNPRPWRVTLRIILAASLVMFAICTWEISVNLRIRTEREFAWVQSASWAELKAEAPERLHMGAPLPDDNEEGYRLGAIQMVAHNSDQALGNLADGGGYALAAALVSLALLIATRSKKLLQGEHAMTAKEALE